MSKILLVEDDSDVSDFVYRGLGRNDYDVLVAETGAKGLELAQIAEPDLVILDLMLPDIDGIEVCRTLRLQSEVGIIILTARGIVGDRVKGLEAGADDYLAKPFAFEELLARIKAVLRRRSPSTEAVIRAGDIEIDSDRREVRRGGKIIQLTTREFDLLYLLAKNKGCPLTREIIVQRLWGYEYEAETDPVKVYINFLRKKLNAGGEPDMIVSLRGFGYVLKDI